MGVITATFGGVVRDVLGGEIPVILRKEIYATAALAGAAAFVGGVMAGLPAAAATFAGFAICLVDPRAGAAARLVAAGLPGAAGSKPG